MRTVAHLHTLYPDTSPIHLRTHERQTHVWEPGILEVYAVDLSNISVSDKASITQTGVFDKRAGERYYCAVRVRAKVARIEERTGEVVNRHRGRLRGVGSNEYDRDDDVETQSEHKKSKERIDTRCRARRCAVMERENWALTFPILPGA
jgi:hypothetical protein